MQHSDNVFSQVTPDKARFILGIADRIMGLVLLHLKHHKDHRPKVETDLMVIRMELALVSVLRGLDLRAMLEADDLLLWSEWGKIQKNVNRVDTSFPLDVSLRFASIGASSRIITFH